jgi:hypothetical protein
MTLAYLDAGTGSMVLQVLLGGIAAVGVGGRVLWQRLSGRRKDGAEAAEGTETTVSGNEASSETT